MDRVAQDGAQIVEGGGRRGGGHVIGGSVAHILRRLARSGTSATASASTENWSCQPSSTDSSGCWISVSRSSG
jgi:hypothetical protein